MKNSHADLIGLNEIDEWSTSRNDDYEDGDNRGKYSLEELALNVGMSGYNWELDFPNHIDRDHLWVDIFDWFDDFDPGYNDYSYACGFAYKTSALELLGCDYVWFNYHGNNGSPDYFFSRNPSHAYGHCGHPCRTLVWAKFRHKVSGTEFYFFVTHLPTKDQIAGDPDAYNVSGYSEARADVSVQCIEVMYAEICEGLPCIMAGDMNRSETGDDGCYASLITYWDDAYNTVNAAGDLGSFYQTYSGTMSGEGLAGSGTPYHYDVLRFCKNHPERRYDQILTRKGTPVTARSYKTIRSANFIEKDDDDVDTTFYPSDHLPVVSYITFD
jgi:endonuclease/exonuclease/phosphatase family metal-dependent hydrolase